MPSPAALVGRRAEETVCAAPVAPNCLLSLAKTRSVGSETWSMASLTASQSVGEHDEPRRPSPPRPSRRTGRRRTARPRASLPRRCPRIRSLSRARASAGSACCSSRGVTTLRLASARNGRMPRASRRDSSTRWVEPLARLVGEAGVDRQPPAAYRSSSAVSPLQQAVVLLRVDGRPALTARPGPPRRR